MTAPQAKAPRARLGNAAVTEGPADAAERVQATRGESLRMVPVGSLSRSPWQPRGPIDPTDLEDLAESIRAHGVLEPLLVRELPGGRLELIAGERRLEGAKLAGLLLVPARVHNVSDTDAAAIAITENLARENLTAWEEARAIATLRDALKTGGAQADVRTLSRLAGRSKSSVQRSLTISDRLTPAVIEMAAVPSWDKLANNAAALLGAAEGETEHERVALLQRYAETPAPGKAAAARNRRQKAAKQGAAPFTLTQGANGRIAVTVRRAVAELAPGEARSLRDQLAPWWRELEERAIGDE